MRLESALRTGREGLITHGLAISVLGDNISNANTPAFKRQRAEFVELLGEHANDRNAEVTPGAGDGVALGQVRLNFETGSALPTGRDLDVAITGRGFFLLGDPAAPRLTRLGNFEIAEDGFLATTDGERVLGYAGLDVNELGPINMAQFNIEPQPSTEVTLFANLNGSAAASPAPANPLTFKEIGAAAGFSNTLNVYDSTGARHDVQLFYFKSNLNQWTVRAYVNGDEVGQQPETPVLLGEVNLTFNNFGEIPFEAQPQASLVINPAWANGAQPVDLTINMSNLTQYAGGSRVNQVLQDGRGNGDVVSYSIEEDGKIFGMLVTGERIQAGTIALGLVNNVDGLERQGGSVFTTSALSGAAVVGRPQIGGRGSLLNQSLEGSNVDLSDQFTEMIIMQRGYQANSQVLSAASDLLKNTIQMIR
jgi:flagellar hook protein FlgE